MPDTTQPSSLLETVQRDQRDLARQNTEIINRLGKIESDRNTETAVAVERRTNLDERLDRIEGNITQIIGLGKWVLGGVGGILLTAIATFIFKGGLVG